MPYTFEATIPSSPSWSWEIDCDDTITGQQDQPQLSINELRAFSALIASLHGLMHKLAISKVEITEA